MSLIHRLYRTRWLSSRLNRITPTLQKIDRLAEPVFLLALAAWVIVFAWLRINGSSIGTYYQYFYGKEKADPALVFGQPREIRGDEFRVATSWTAAQAQRDFPQYNDLFGVSGQTLFFYDVPVKDFTLIFKPHLWAFLFLPLENAFALKWWFRGALFILSLYLLFRRFTGGKVFLSIGAALAVFYAPFIQWWYSISLIDTITYYLLLYETFIRLFEYRRRVELYGYAGLFAFLAVTLIFFFYPPALISVGWIFIFMAGGYVWYQRDLLTRERIFNYLRAGAASAAVIGAFGLAFYLDYKPVFNLINNTIYPGQRTAPMEGYSLQVLLSGFFNIQMLQSPITIPRIFPPNECEASGFFMFGIFLLPVMLFLISWNYWRTRKVPFWSILITLVFVIFLRWIINPPPLAFASLFLMSNVPFYRMILAVGTINFILVFWYLFGTPIPKHRFFHWACIAGGVAVSLYYINFGYFLKNDYPGYIVLPEKIVGIALFAGLAFYFLLQKRTALFVTLLLVFSFMSSYSVNPLYQGLGELTQGKLARTIQAVNQRDGGKSRWVMYDNRLMNILQANGAKGVSGVYYYPDFAMYRVLDPVGQFNEVYNRYSHAMLVPEYNDGPFFKLLSNDGYALFIHPCSDALRALNVKYQVFLGQSDAGCLQEVDHVEYSQGDYYIYEFKQP